MNVPSVRDSSPVDACPPYDRAMDRVDVEALVVRLVDQVEHSGYAAEYDVENSSSLQILLQQEARRRGLLIRTGTVTADEHAVWAYRPKED